MRMCANDSPGWGWPSAPEVAMYNIVGIPSKVAPFILLQIKWIPWIGGYRTQIPILSAVYPQLNVLDATSSKPNSARKKIMGTRLRHTRSIVWDCKCSNNATCCMNKSVTLWTQINLWVWRTINLWFGEHHHGGASPYGPVETCACSATCGWLNITCSRLGSVVS
jgi:hypothetical protein